MKRAQGAWGSTATLPTCAHLSPDSQARLHRAGSVPCKPKTLKMSAYGTFFPYCATPKGSCQHRGRCPHPRSPRGRGAGKNLLHPYHRETLGRLQPVKGQAATRLLRKPLTGFQLRPLRLVLLPPRRWRGVKGDEVVHFTLDALESTTLSP